MQEYDGKGDGVSMFGQWTETRASYEDPGTGSWAGVKQNTAAQGSGSQQGNNNYHREGWISWDGIECHRFAHRYTKGQSIFPWKVYPNSKGKSSSDFAWCQRGNAVMQRMSVLWGSCSLGCISTRWTLYMEFSGEGLFQRQTRPWHIDESMD